MSAGTDYIARYGATGAATCRTVRIDRPGPTRPAARADIAAAGPMADPPSGPDRIGGRPLVTAAEDRIDARRAIGRAARIAAHDAAIARLDARDIRTGGRWTGD